MADSRLSRDSRIELLRFLFAVIVVMVHTNGLRPESEHYPFVGGYLAVEFFLILTGYFTSRTLETAAREIQSGKEGIYAIRFIIQKFKPLFPYILISVMGYYTVVACFAHISAGEFFKSMASALYEVFLLPMSGIHASFYVLPLWYLSGVLLVLPILVYLALRLPELFPLVVAGVPIYVYGYLSINYGEVDVWNVWTGLTYIGIWRVAAGLCLGFVCARLAKEIRITKISGLVKRLLSIACFGVFFICIFFRGHTKFDFLLIALLLIGTCFLGSDDPQNPPHLTGRLFIFLGRLSIPLYTSHWIVRYAVATFMPQASYWEMLPVYLALSFLLTLILYFMVRKTWGILSKYTQKGSG